MQYNFLHKHFPLQYQLVLHRIRAVSILLSLLFFFQNHAATQQTEWSISPGFYQTTQVLEMTSDWDDADIYYTLDGSDPLTSGQLFQSGIDLDFRENDPNVVSEIPTNNLGPGQIYRENWLPPQGNVQKIHTVRAVAIHPDGTVGDEKSGSFIIHPAGKNLYSFPLVSIITEADNFFGHEDGIYVPGATGGNYFQRGREWERPVFIEYFDSSATRVIAQHAGARIHGGTSRNRPRKSLRLYARSDYGTTWFDHDFFPDKNTSRNKRFLLRNSGNDWSESLFRDAFLQNLLINNSALDIQHYQPVVVFINGEYWGLHNLRDRLDARYLQAHYDLNPDRVTVLERDGELDHGNADGIGLYRDMFDFIAGEDMSNPEKYNEARLLMDTDNFIDYQIIHIYTRNTDWPGNNVSYWRYLDGEAKADDYHPADGRWRWMVFDLDFGFGLDFDYVLNSASQYGQNDAFHNTVSFALEPNGPSWPNPAWSTTLFRNLMENQEFKNRFITRFADHLNTSFRAEWVLDKLGGFEEMFISELEEHIQRWNEPGHDHWENDLQRMKTFGLLREPLMRNHINSTLNLNGTIEVNINVVEKGAGIVKLNSILLHPTTDGVANPTYPWSGIYFEDIPISFEAIPDAGYRFSHWSGDVESEDSIAYITPTGNVDIAAHFEKVGEFGGNELNPIAHWLSNGAYNFNYWSAGEPEHEFPPHIFFLQSEVSDPVLTTEMSSTYFIPYNSPQDNEYHANDQDKIGFPYSLTGRTRINGLGNRGISMINTGRGRDLGAVVLALNTKGVTDAKLEFETETLDLNSRKYNLILQYRTGILDGWKKFPDEDGNPVIHQSLNDGSKNHFTDLKLPEELMDRDYVQLRWKYYYTGIRRTQEFGSRDEIRLDNIYIRPDTASNIRELDRPGGSLSPPFPNPTDNSAEIRLSVFEIGDGWLTISDLRGTQLRTIFKGHLEKGQHAFTTNTGGLLPGVYLINFHFNGRVDSQKLSVFRN
jgi:hypothetical protein